MSSLLATRVVFGAVGYALSVFDSEARGGEGRVNDGDIGCVDASFLYDDLRVRVHFMIVVKVEERYVESCTSESATWWQRCVAGKLKAQCAAKCENNE